jgi:hypothetical protein
MTGPTVKVVSLNTMPVMPIWTRLGYREKTADQQAIRPKYEPIIQRLVNETRVRVFFLEKNIQIENNEVVLGAHRFSSTLIQTRFAQARSVYLLGASAHPDDMLLLERYHEQDMQQAVVLDAILSEKVDFGLDFIEKELTVDLRRQGMKSGQRLSCGYSDFALENQQYFYQELGFEKYGIRINERHILSPEKTVTALLPLYGLEKEHE